MLLTCWNMCLGRVAGRDSMSYIAREVKGAPSMRLAYIRDLRPLH